MKDNGIQITLVKKEKDWWPRLIYQQHKLPWLKIDFDRWKDADEDGEDSDEAAAGKAKKDDPFGHMTTEDMIRNKYPDIYKDLEKEELGFVSESTRKVYLACYNLFMTWGFIYVFAVLIIRQVLTYGTSVFQMRNCTSMFSRGLFCAFCKKKPSTYLPKIPDARFEVFQKLGYFIEFIPI